ncbi:MAG: DUF6029 family protein [Saprospiraceae bacterium]
MKIRFNYILTLLLFFYSFVTNAQTETNNSSSGIFNAYLHTQAGIFIRDSTIGASNTPQYDHQLFGGETWLNMTYTNWGMEFGLRADLYQNSNLINPQASFNKQGIGRWYVKRDVERLGFEAGYIYDQIGSGIIYRAYEQRNLGLDNALFGLKLNYKINGNWHAKAFSGKQKKQFDTYESLIKGINLEGFVQSNDSAHWSMAPGIGVINRTLDDASLNNVIATLGTYQPKDQFLPKYNSYAFTIYDQINIKDVSIYIETAIKPRDIINNPNGVRTNNAGEEVIGPTFVNKPGQVLYGSINYAKKGYGISFEAKRTQYFSLRTRPQEELNNGLIHFVPPMSRQNSYRLLTFYQPATQEIGELAFQGELQVSPMKDWTLIIHHSNINDLNNNKLYREYLFESTLIRYGQYVFIAGVQHQEYNQQVYEGKPNAPVVKSYTPYIDYTYQFDDTHSLRTDIEYMINKQDQGSWTNILLEYSIAPQWIFTASDMYNIKPLKGKKNNYYTAGVTYSQNVTRFSANWVRQRAGIVCTGGICRYEPAFNGLKFSLETRF